MQGLKFDFDSGDLKINASGRFDSGFIDNQNVALIGVSQVCRLTRPEIGAQIGSRVINLKSSNVSSILFDAKRQAEQDGATNVRIELTDDKQLIFIGTYED